MSQTTVNLGYVLINRGEYVADPVTKYYKDNVVQYLGSAFIAAPVDYDEETNPLAYVTTAPYDTDPNNPNEGWKVFASDAAYVNSFMFFTENPEWAYVVCDKEDKILFGVKQDGKFYFGDGCPPQVQEYVEERIKEVSPENYEQVLAFLQDYLGSDTTLKMIIDALDAAKLDKEGLDAEALKVQTLVDSPEYLQVTTDSEDKILEGIKSDGTKVIGADLNVGGNSVLNGNLQVLGSLDISGATYSLCQSPEWIKVLVDSQERIIAGVRTDGSVYIGQLEGLDDKLQEMLTQMQAMLDEAEAEIDAKLAVFNSVFNIVDNPEWIQVTTDSEGKILEGITAEGKKKVMVETQVDDSLSAKKVDIDGATIENINDPEGRIEIKTDAESKILSYRDSEGVVHENVGIEAAKLILTDNGAENLKSQLDKVPVKKNWYLPKFGKVNIKSETFYLTADSRWSTKDDVVCIQMYDDNDANAAQRLTLSYYYIKSTLTPLAGGGYDRTSVNENSVQLQLFPGKDVVESNGQYFVKKITKVNGEYYLTSTLAENNGVYDINYLYGQANSMKVNYTDANPDQTTVTNAIEVGKITDAPPVKAWFVGKQLEHYCVADIDFDSFYANNNVPVGIKYQGSGTTAIRKRGFRLTYYKKNDYKKKDKVKVGEMVRLSGFNMKAYGNDPTRIKDPILSNIFIEMWETRGKDAYPWNAYNCVYNGATGFIKSFPIELDFGSDFYGLYFFGLKKDEKNYMLDGTDESGIFVSGANDSRTKCFDNVTHLDFEDEMMDEMSQETANAIDEFLKYTKGFTDGNIEIDGQVIDFTNDMLEERLDINNWIDYWIGLEAFLLYDNAFHNSIVYSAKDKRKFSLFFYDLDGVMTYGNIYSSYVDVMHYLNWNIQFWEKFVEVYKDYILNRYVTLRNSILSDSNITNIYKNYIIGIPDNIVNKEKLKWGNGDPQEYRFFLDKIKARLKYLDNIKFNLKIN